MFWSYRRLFLIMVYDYLHEHLSQWQVLARHYKRVCDIDLYEISLIDTSKASSIHQPVLTLYSNRKRIAYSTETSIWHAWLHCIGYNIGLMPNENILTYQLHITFVKMWSKATPILNASPFDIYFAASGHYFHSIFRYQN